MAMMIPSPTAASAAATVITMKTKSWPVTSRKKLENATNVRFTALSISSMHMNIEITLRLIITPTTPIVNSTAESAKYHESCGTITTQKSEIRDQNLIQNRITLHRDDLARLKRRVIPQPLLKFALRLASDPASPLGSKLLARSFDNQAQRQRLCR